MANIPFLNNAYFSAKVGIGTDSPQGILDVRSDASNSVPKIIVGNSTTTYNQTNSGSIVFTEGGTFEHMEITYNGASNKLLFNSPIDSATGLLTINRTGNVGIGTTSPSASHKLDVNGAGRFSGNVTSTGNISARSFDMNSTYDSSNQYLQLHKNQANDGGILLRSRTAAGAGQVDWQIVNQGTTGDLKFYAYGLADYAFVLDRETGNLQLPEYGAGTLVSDASGNITVSSGGGAGGPYLPLAGGTLSGDLTMNDSDVVFKHTDGFNYYRVGVGTNANFEIYNTNYSRTDLLITQSTGNATFVGDVTIPEYIYHTGDANTRFGFSSNDNFLVETGGINMFGVNATTVFLKHTGNTKLITTSTGISVTGDIQIDSALLSNQENTDVDTGTETVANVAIATYTAAFFDFVIKKTTNVRSGTVYACHDGTNVEFTETSTNDLGDTSDVTLSVDISGTNMRLLATVTSDDWSVKSLIRAI